MKSKILITSLGILCALLIFETGYLIGIGEQTRVSSRALLNQYRPISRMQHVEPYWSFPRREMAVIEQSKRSLGEQKRSFFVAAMTSKETDRAIIVTINLPGLDKKDISLEVRGRYLSIQVKQNFVQIITLPENIKAQKISAEYNEDTLIITVPKAKAANTKAPSVIKIPLR